MLEVPVTVARTAAVIAVAITTAALRYATAGWRRAGGRVRRRRRAGGRARLRRRAGGRRWWGRRSGARGRGLSRRRDGDGRRSADGERGGGANRAAGEEEHIEEMAPRREVVEGETSRTGPREATIEHIPEPLRATDRGIADGDAHRECRACVRAHPGREDRQLRRRSGDRRRSGGRPSRCAHPGRCGRPRRGRGAAATATCCEGQRQAHTERPDSEGCRHDAPLTSPRSLSNFDISAPTNWPFRSQTPRFVLSSRPSVGFLPTRADVRYNLTSSASVNELLIRPSVIRPSG
jgi:hypothetical protein